MVVDLRCFSACFFDGKGFLEWREMTYRGFDLQKLFRKDADRTLTCNRQKQDSFWVTKLVIEAMSGRWGRSICTSSIEHLSNVWMTKDTAQCARIPRPKDEHAHKSIFMEHGGEVQCRPTRACWWRSIDVGDFTLLIWAMNQFLWITVENLLGYYWYLLIRYHWIHIDIFIIQTIIVL